MKKIMFLMLCLMLVLPVQAGIDLDGNYIIVKNVKNTVEFDGNIQESTNWKIMIASDTDFKRGAYNSGDYPYFVQEINGDTDEKIPIDGLRDGNYLAELYEPGIGATDGITFTKAAATPEPTPVPTPQPTPIETPIQINIIPTVTSTASPVPTQISNQPQQIQQQSPASKIEYGTFRFKSYPEGATIYINDVPMREKTPTVRDFRPGRYNIRLELEGYLSSNRTIMLDDFDDRTIFDELEPVRPEVTQTPVQTEIQPEVTLPPKVITDIETTNTTDMSATDSDTTKLNFVVGMTLLAIVAVLALLWQRTRTVYECHDIDSDVSNDTSDNEESEDSSTAQKIIGLIKYNPGITNAELAEKIGVTVRTIERNVAQLKKDGKI